VTAEPASLRPVAGGPADVALLLASWLDAGDPSPLSVRTSGSTGEPKQVLLSPGAVRASAEASVHRLGGPGQWVLALPPHYVAGLQVLVRSHLAGIVPIVLSDQLDLPAATARLSLRRRYLACVPTQLHRWLTADGPAEALTEFDAVLVGGAPAGDRVLATARDRGVRLVATYGMSETCGGCVYDGIALDGVAIALGTDGRIRISGPVLFDGYDGRPDLTADALHDGWLHTPDLGRIDLDGRLVVTGRSDDLVKSGGITVPLAAVERRLSAMPGVEEVAVLATPDPEWGSRVVAVVVAAQPPELSAVRDFVGDVHPRTWAPREVKVIDRLPRLPSGKVDRKRLASTLAAAP
jgi:O-succinylbenzoic acid--CoA ligase